MARFRDAEWLCRCGARNEEGSRYCEGCGVENPRAPRGNETPQQHAPEGYRPAREVLANCTGPKPLPDEVNMQAARILRETLAGKVRWAEARGQLEELFGDDVVRRALVVD